MPLHSLHSTPLHSNQTFFFWFLWSELPYTEIKPTTTTTCHSSLVMLSLILLECQGNLHLVAIPSICFRGPCIDIRITFFYTDLWVMIEFWILDHFNDWFGIWFYADKGKWTFWFLPSMRFWCLAQSTPGFSTLQVQRKNIRILKLCSLVYSKISVILFWLWSISQTKDRN